MRTIDQIFNSLRKRIISEFQKVNPDIVDAQTGLESPLALAHAAEFRIMETLIEQLSRETNPSTATSREDSSIGMLEYFGDAKYITREPAQAGVFRAQFSTTAGATVPRGANLRADNGIELTVVNEVVAPANSDNVLITLVTNGAGSQFAIFPPTPVRFVQGIAGIEERGTVITADPQAQDRESIEDFRRRVIAAYSALSNGGNIRDYRLWAQKVSGIAQVYPYPALTVNDVAGAVYLGLGFPTVFVEGVKNPVSASIINNFMDIISQNAPLGGGQIHVKPCIPLHLTFDFNTQNEIRGEELNRARVAFGDIVRSYLRERRPFIEALDDENTSRISPVEVFLRARQPLQEEGVVILGVSMGIIESNAVRNVSEYYLRPGEIPVLGTPTSW